MEKKTEKLRINEKKVWSRIDTWSKIIGQCNFNFSGNSYLGSRPFQTLCTLNDTKYMEL